MAEIIKITKGQPFALFIPCVILNTDDTKEAVQTDNLNNIQVRLQHACDNYACNCHTHDHFIVLDLTADLPTGEFAAIITATLPSGRPFTLRIKRAFEIVEWDYQSNWKRYIINEHIQLSDQPLIAGNYPTSTDLDQLKAEYQAKIAAAEAAKAETEQQLAAIAQLLTTVSMATLATEEEQRQALQDLNDQLDGTQQDESQEQETQEQE